MIEKEAQECGWAGKGNGDTCFASSAQQGVELKLNGSREALLHGYLHIIWETGVGKIVSLAWAIVFVGRHGISGSAFDGSGRGEENVILQFTSLNQPDLTERVHKGKLTEMLWHSMTG